MSTTRDRRRPGTRRRRRRPDPERAARRAARREAFLDAAEAAIARHGPDASMEEIAAEAGVTKPIVYRVFGDRAGLVAALGERFAERLVAVLGDVLGTAPPSRDLLVATVNAYLRFIEAEPHVYAFLSRRALAEDPERVVGVMRRVAQQTAVVLGEAMRERGLDSGAAEPWAYGLVGMVHLAGDWWIEHRTMPRERLVAYLASLAWSGLGGAVADDRDNGDEGETS